MSFARLLNRGRAIRRLEAIPGEVKKRVAAQLAANAADMTALTKRRVAVAEVDGGQLRDSIRHFTVNDPARIRERVVAGGPETTTPSPTGKPYSYARAVEFGTSEVEAQPFFFPTYRGRKKAYKRALNKAGKEGIAEATRKA